MNAIRAWAARSAGRALEPYEFDPGPLGPEEVEIAVEYCGICHSDLSVIDNEWGISTYPVVPGHEAVGRVVALGDQAKGLTLGQRVGVGWNSGSCLYCRHCLAGDQHLCVRIQPTIVGHHGAFADRLRAHWVWVIPIPEALDASTVGPLLCGGITVFSPLLDFDVKPTHRVGVVGIGGLGHMALKLLNAWGSEVTAFTTSEAKYEEAKTLGAHHVVFSRKPETMKAIAGSLDMILDTVNVPLDWKAMVATLAPKGRLHVVGAVLEPIPVIAMSLISGQRSVSGSPTGSRSTIDMMLDFAARHGIAPQVEHFPMSRVNDALEHLRAGKARYRIVLDADFA
ncbi:NADPH-dependent aldehyde reductase Ahr [Methylocaldum sp.]|uniref:NADPH-dependent aldehyde reductase Ahr n=1 Tax=Methylocaldum sp. TaxID=1969727 RepID=UPI002D30309D|nr:NAD(P)-dependent alcohol dehydrogenase [Methylocaldum sp.]HYE34263.1 NAD(P)-dependent alcohol dehydrogenase [Methylocaldum sp.]